MAGLICTRCGSPKHVRVLSVAVGKISRTLFCPCSNRAVAAAWIERNLAKRAAHRAVEKAINQGALVQQPCEVWGDEKGEAHHDDYRAPLDVTWLCRKHHALQHKRGSHAALEQM